MKGLERIKRIDYRHYICVLITLGCIAMGVYVFGNALGRLVEAGRDFGLSIGYYFCELLKIPHNITPTVNDLPRVPFFPIPGSSGSSAGTTTPLPAIPLPDTFVGFKAKWTAYWRLWANKNNFAEYAVFLGNTAYNICLAVLIILPLLLVVYVLLKRYLEAENNDYNTDSKALKRFKRVSDCTYRPVKQWVRTFVEFVKEHSVYYKIWLGLWLLYFNAYTIALEFLAYYFYFVVSFDVVNLYRQVYKLFIDVTPLLTFVPLWAWVIIGLLLFDRWRKRIGYSALNRYERRNRGFINARPLVTMVCGTMGRKKTTTITDMALSEEVLLRDKALELLLDNDLKFPYFPWINLENEIKAAMAYHGVYSLSTVERFIRNWRRWFAAVREDKATRKSWFRHCAKHDHRYPDLIFGYDYDRYGMTYDDGLQVVNVWDVIETYAKLYFIYVMQSSLLVANYSIRTDMLLKDLGNFPLWDANFFRRDSKRIDSYSRHAHILDFDALRLGRKVLENNPNKDALEFGVIVITEVGKERGNMFELKEVKKKVEETNQKNDLFNTALKMIRHPSTVDNFPFVKVLTDEQRPESWGADARDLCEIVHVRKSAEPILAMPFFAAEELLYGCLFGRFEKLYLQYRHNRGDNTLTMYLLKSVTAKIHGYYRKIYNTFSYVPLKVQVEDGTQDGKMANHTYYLTSKKIYSKRFSTDCYSDFFRKKSVGAAVSLNDLPEYATEKATFDELKRQNSYFINDLVHTESKEK